MIRALQAVGGLTPDTQLVLALCVFVVVIALTISAPVRQFLLELLTLWFRNRQLPKKQPKEPPQTRA